MELGCYNTCFEWFILLCYLPLFFFLIGNDIYFLELFTLGIYCPRLITDYLFHEIFFSFHNSNDFYLFRDKVKHLLQLYICFILIGINIVTKLNRRLKIITISNQISKQLKCLNYIELFRIAFIVKNNFLFKQNEKKKQKLHAH